MQNRSATIIGAIVVILGTLFGLIGIPITQADVQSFAETVSEIVAGIVIIIATIKIWIERVKKGDVKLLGARTGTLQLKREDL